MCCVCAAATFAVQMHIEFNRQRVEHARANDGEGCARVFREEEIFQIYLSLSNFSCFASECRIWVTVSARTRVKIIVSVEDASFFSV